MSISKETSTNIHNYIYETYKPPPLTNQQEMPQKVSNDIFDNVEDIFNYQELNEIYKEVCEKAYTLIKEMNIEQKIDYFKLTSEDDVKKLERSDKKSYINGDECYEIIIHFRNLTSSEEEEESEEEDVKEITIVEEDTNVKEITTPICEEVSPPSKVSTRTIETQTDFKVVNDITTTSKITKIIPNIVAPQHHIKKKGLKLFDIHYNHMFPCNCDKIDDRQLYNKLKKNKSNLRTEYKKYLDGVPLNECKDIPKLTMMIYIIKNVNLV